MKKPFFQSLTLLIALTIYFSCSKETDNNTVIKEGTGTVWLSGGLYFCAVQIRMEKGDTLIPVDRENERKVIRFNGDDRVNPKLSDSEQKSLPML